MLSRILLSILLLSAPTVFGAQLKNATGIPQGAIDESEGLLTLSIDGEQISSLDQIHEIFIQGLKLPTNYEKTFVSMLSFLSNSQNTPKQTQIVITSGEQLRLKLGSQNMDNLMSVLNQAEEANLDADGFKKLFILFWQ